MEEFLKVSYVMTATYMGERVCSLLVIMGLNAVM